MKAKQYLVKCLKRGTGSAVGAAAIFVANISVAQVVVDEGIRPYALAPYVLERSILEPRPENEFGGTFAYRPWFENGAWTGDLIQYVIQEDGQRISRPDIGAFPNDSTTTWRGTVHPTPWSARYSFADWTYVQDGDTGGLSCVEEDDEYWLATNRKIYTYSDRTTVPFLWNELSIEQRSAIDAGIAADIDLENEPYASGILNFLRGDRSNEACKGGQFRMRYSLLGAVINSQPVYIPPVGTNAHGLAVVGANAGMLHGFSTNDGSELFAYVPSMLMGKLNQVPYENYRTYFVDGELRHRDIGDADNPNHIVAGGLGAGARGIFILDVSSPSNPTVIREISGSDTPYNTSSLHDTYREEIGYIQGRPVIARLNTGIAGVDDAGWYVISGNGYDSVSNVATLALIPLDPSRNPVILETDSQPDNGLSAPALIDINGDGFVDIAYAGDLRGRMWRFNLRTGEQKILYDAGPTKPITAEPDVADHPRLGGHMVYFGTGQLLSPADVSADPNQPRQSVYGIWDRGLGADSTLTDLSSEVLQQTLVTHTDQRTLTAETSPCLGGDPDVSTTVRIVPNQDPIYWGATHRGWRVDLPRPGERVIRAVQVRAERVQFVTTNPADMRERDEDPDAGSWMMQLNMETGASPANISKRRALFDLNRNCSLDSDDAVTFGTDPDATSTYFPIGINLGAFHIAQPAFARVRFDALAAAVIDGVYINALDLPIQEITAPPLSLPIDVTTDVPIGPASTTPVWHEYDPADPYYPGRDGWYPEPVRLDTGTPQRPLRDATGPIKPYLGADGPGNRVDGHSSGYNRVHGVNYVDFINLEPRRGQFRLDVGSVFEDVVSTCENGDADRDCTVKLINPRKAEPELHRVTEILSDDQDFIVMLANADLSQKNEIRIGCRTWPVYEYQTMMMQHLRSITTLRAANQNETAEHRGLGQSVAGFVDQNGLSLVFKLSDFYDANGKQITCPDKQPATLRITVTSTRPEIRSMHGTLPGCVVNTHDYEGLTKAAAESGSAEDLYVSQPHVTPNQEGDGYRWRNGALTVQLLAVNNGSAAFELQSRRHWPIAPNRVQGTSTVEGVSQGFGGAYARGVVSISHDNQNQVTAVPRPASEPNGLLYESSIFWHWGDMQRFQQRGASNPSSPSCYSAAGQQQINNEILGLLNSQYKNMVEDFDETDQRLYAQLLADIAAGINVEDNINALQNLFDKEIGSWGAQTGLTIAEYHRMRIYVPSSKVHTDSLLGIDRENFTFGREDGGTPAEVIDIERDLLPSLGPNYQPGRRSWIDLTPEEPTP